LKIAPSDKQTAVIKRNTAKYFWVFDINEETKDYLKKEILNTIGLTDKVYHIFVQQGNDLIFESVDNFSDDCVMFYERDWVDKNFIEGLKSEGIIWRYMEKIFE